MAFITTNSNGEHKEFTGVKIDWDGYNRYKVETIGADEKPETLKGVVTQIIDLGNQKQPDAEYTFTGSPEDEAAEILKNPNTYFKDGQDDKGNNIRLKCFPVKDAQSVVFSVDFPEIQLRDASEFENEEAATKPLRLISGGDFYIPTVGRIVGRMLPINVKNINTNKTAKPIWSLATNSTLYKMAVDTGIIKTGEPFTPQRIDELLGKTFLFSVSAKNNEKNGKLYYKEKLKYLGGIGKRDKSFEVDKTDLVMFSQESDEKTIKELRKYVVDTMKLASNFEGSQIQKDIEAYRGVDNSQENDQTDDSNEQPEKVNQTSPDDF